MNQNYNIEVLISTVDEALTEEQEWQTFVKTWKPGYVSDMHPEKVYQYYHREGRMNSAWNAVQVVCRLLDIDQDAVIGVVKSMNRYMRHHRRWDRMAHVTNEKSFCRFITNNFEDRYKYLCYQSTGRKIK